MLYNSTYTPVLILRMYSWFSFTLGNQFIPIRATFPHALESLTPGISISRRPVNSPKELKSGWTFLMFYNFRRQCMALFSPKKTLRSLRRNKKRNKTSKLGIHDIHDACTLNAAFFLSHSNRSIYIHRLLELKPL